MTMPKERFEELVEIYNTLKHEMPTSGTVDELWERQVLLASLAVQIEQIRLLNSIIRRQ